jgi:hypothetical protein
MIENPASRSQPKIETAITNYGTMNRQPLQLKTTAAAGQHIRRGLFVGQ